jgi:hypothetical protein
MSKKQFIASFVLLSIVSILYVYNEVAAISSRGECGKYAMTRTIDSFSNSMESKDGSFSSRRLEASVSQDAKANYDFFYDFCLDQRGIYR